MELKKGLCILWLLCVVIINAQTTVFQAHLSGWYPTEKTELAAELDQLDRQAREQYSAAIDRDIRAIIVPHAGYRYSGTVAASVYRLLDKNSYKTAIVICPAHTELFDGIGLPTFSSYEVPNGTITIARSIIEELANESPFVYDDISYQQEHAIEIQLPLIKRYLPKAHVVPLIIGKVTEEQLQDAALVLKKFINKKTLVIVSSDFTHYGKRFSYMPFEDYQSLRVKELDNQAVMLIQKAKPEPFAQFIVKSGTTICGHQALELLLDLINQDTFDDVEPRVIAYAQSSPLVDAASESVSYVGLTFTNKKLEQLAPDQQINQFERRELVKTARLALEHLFDEDFPKELTAPISTPFIRAMHGAFVTLKIKKTGVLRGCIGNIVGVEPLVPTIIRLTRDAALHDTRFVPVTLGEIPSLTLEISLLSRPKRIKSSTEIKLGTHGIILHHGKNQAVYLPEVAPEQKWDLATTLASLSEKAGLDAQAWRDKNSWFEIFESLKIHE